MNVQELVSDSSDSSVKIHTDVLDIIRVAASNKTPEEVSKSLMVKAMYKEALAAMRLAASPENDVSRSALYLSACGIAIELGEFDFAKLMAMATVNYYNDDKTLEEVQEVLYGIEEAKARYLGINEAIFFIATGDNDELIDCFFVRADSFSDDEIESFQAGVDQEDIDRIEEATMIIKAPFSVAKIVPISVGRLRKKKPSEAAKKKPEPFWVVVTEKDEDDPESWDPSGLPYKVVDSYTDPNARLMYVLRPLGLSHSEKDYPCPADHTGPYRK